MTAGDGLNVKRGRGGMVDPVVVHIRWERTARACFARYERGRGWA